MVTATFTDGLALICEISSHPKNGVYLVKVETDGKQIVVHHACPVVHRGCSHVQEAVSCFQDWRAASNEAPLFIRSEKVTLRPEWVQIPIPGGPEKDRELAMAGEHYAP